MLTSCTQALTLVTTLGYTLHTGSLITHLFFFPKQEWTVSKGVSEPNLKKRTKKQNLKQTLPDAVYMQEAEFFLSKDLLPSL